MTLDRLRTYLPTLVTALALSGCAADTPTAPTAPGGVDASLSGVGPPIVMTHRQYGPPTRLGDGRIRAYAVVGGDAAHTPSEIGIAIDEQVLDGLAGSEAGMFVIPLPPKAPAPYTFAMVDWNPAGHEPPGVYTFPHFDFHFYTVPWSEVEAITPSDPDFASEANHLPSGDYVPPFYVVLTPPGADPASVAVPEMGVHWNDVRSPELQGMLGNPGGYQPFTKTFIYGSWDGRFTFLEPMITTAYLQTRPDEVVPISTPARYAEPGWYPSSYRITYDPQAREYRVALTGLTWHE